MAQTQGWDDRRLDSLASVVAANAEAIERQSQTSERLQAAVAVNIESIERQNQTNEVLQTAMLKLTDVLNEILPRIDRMQNEFDQIQTEIKGLRTENRRILDRMFGDESDD